MNFFDIAGFSAEVVRLGAGRPRLLIGIDGPGASGKSTLADQLAARLAGAVVVHVDDFYLPSADRASRAGQVGELFDLPRLGEQVVTPAATGTELRYQRYDWDRDALADWLTVPARAPVIVEGIYSLQRSFRAAYTASVFCLAARSLRLRRGLDRDGEDMRDTWENTWMPAEDEYMETERPQDYATVVVDSSADANGGQARFLLRRHGS